MDKIDLLEAIHKGTISMDVAYEMFKNFKNYEDVDEDWASYFGFSKYEATAYAHGANFADLLYFRYEGWPTTCYRCGKLLDYKKFSWLPHRDEDGEPKLRHLECPVG